MRDSREIFPGVHEEAETVSWKQRADEWALDVRGREGERYVALEGELVQGIIAEFPQDVEASKGGNPNQPQSPDILEVLKRADTIQPNDLDPSGPPARVGFKATGNQIYKLYENLKLKGKLDVDDVVAHSMATIERGYLDAKNKEPFWTKKVVNKFFKRKQ